MCQGDSVLMCEVRTNFGVGQQTFLLRTPRMLKISSPLSMGGRCGSKANTDLMSLGHEKNLASLDFFLLLQLCFSERPSEEGGMAVDQTKCKVHWGFLFALFLLDGLV